MGKVVNRLRESKTKLKSLPFNKMAPNLVTLLALCSGLSSIKFSILGDWERAVIFIFVAGVLDGLDGRVARLLKAESKFGAELDSLSDFLCFGVAPSILLYQWTMSDAGGLGWFLCMLYTICMCLRLARFNTMLEDEPMPTYWQHFFVGVPAPAAAAIVLLPVLISFDLPVDIDWVKSNYFSGIMLCLVAILMVSKIPTFSSKKAKVPSFMIVPLMLFVTLFASYMISQPWMTLAAIVGIYLLSIPVGILFFISQKKKS